MAEQNLYEAPRDSPSSSPLERRTAITLLKCRHNGYTIGLFYRMLLRGYIILTLWIVGAVVYFNIIGNIPMAYAMIGVYFGVLLRDFGFARNQARTWGIQSRLLDWTKVDRMAAGEQVES